MEPEATRERIAELERQLAEAMAAAQAEDRGSEQSARALDRIAELSDELGQLLQTDRQSPSSARTPERAAVFGSVSEPRRRIPFGLVMLVIVVLGLLAVPVVSAIYANRGAGDTDSATAGDTPPAVTTVPRGGQLRVGASLGQKRTVDCNGGNLTLYGTGVFSVTGHCVSLTTGATYSEVSVESADVVNITGYDSKYFIAGQGGGLTVTNDNNEVHIDGVDAINLSGDNNTVTYKSGSPEVADRGQSNDIAAKK
jgi:Protein of unknown function (DUF3060)